MLNRLTKRLHSQEGFTLIELLVVILIIGILAAIAIPAFLNQKGKGEDAGAKSTVKSVQTALETFYTDNSSYNCSTVPAVAPYAAGCDTALHQIEKELPGYGGNAGQWSISGPSNDSYTITVFSDPSNRKFQIVNTAGTITRPCNAPTTLNNNGGCKVTNASNGDGIW